MKDSARKTSFYNEESFFVRHAYFSGADEPYEKIKRALKAEIDESAWLTIYSTKSRPFPMPLTGKIAEKKLLITTGLRF